MPRAAMPEPFRPEESPVTWFGELVLAIDRGDFKRAAESQHQLDRLGWKVVRKRHQRPHETTPSHGGGR
jgi:hypothetical protein